MPVAATMTTQCMMEQTKNKQTHVYSILRSNFKRKINMMLMGEVVKIGKTKQRKVPDNSTRQKQKNHILVSVTQTTRCQVHIKTMNN